MDERTARALVDPESTVRAALQELDASGMRIALVAGSDGRLLGVLTDGDVRRWILSGRGLDEPVTAAMNPDPVCVSPGYGEQELHALMVERGIDFVPVVSEGVLVGSVRWTDVVSDEEDRVASASLGLPVVMMAGGAGTRLAPYTSILPKPLVPVGEKPVAEVIMDRFARFGCDRFLVSVNYRANLIRAYFADASLPYDITFIDESQPLGTGGSLSLMREELAGTPFFVTNCDILIEADYADVYRHHREAGNAITIVASVKHMTVPYGVCEIAEGGQVTGMTEKPEFDYLVSTGFYLLEPDVLDDVPDDSFFHLTELIDGYVARGRSVGVYPISEKSWSDIGQIEELKATLAHLAVE